MPQVNKEKRKELKKIYEEVKKMKKAGLLPSKIAKIYGKTRQWVWLITSGRDFRGNKVKTKV